MTTQERKATEKRIFAPSADVVRSSRERVRAIIKASKGRPHPFTRGDFEAIAETVFSQSGSAELTKNKSER